MFYICSSVLVLIFLLDINMLKTFDLINKTSSSNYGIFIFLGVAATFFILSSIILKYNWNYINQYIKKSNRIYTIFKITLLTQILLFSFLLLLNFQVIIFHYYSTYIIMISLLISYSLSFFILFFLPTNFYIGII